jgi:hypothetical protein
MGIRNGIKLSERTPLKLGQEVNEPKGVNADIQHAMAGDYNLNIDLAANLHGVEPHAVGQITD